MPPIRITSAEQLIREGVNKLETLRRRWLNWFLASWGTSIVLGAFAFGVYSNLPSETLVWGITAGVAVLGTIVMTSLTGKKRNDFHQQFNNWRDRVIRHIDAGASFTPNHCVAKSAFDASSLNAAFYNTYGGNNYLSLGDFQSSNLSVKHIYKETYNETVTETDSQGRTTTRQVQKERTVVVQIYDGLFLVFPAKLPSPGAVLLRNRGAGTPKEMRKITVASPDLNNNYEICASEPFVGHRTMTPTLMEALWEYRSEFKYLPGYSYKNDLLYVTVPGFWIGYGETPGKWTAVTLSKLEKIVSACEASISFLKTTAEKLQPT